VALNMGPAAQDLTLGATPHAVALSTHRSHEGPHRDPVLRLDAWEGVVITNRG